MTEQEQRELRALSERLAKAERSPWEPCCVVRAFLRKPKTVAGITLHPLTLAGHLRLNEMRSPLLLGRWPEEGQEIMEAVAGAVSVFSGREWTVDSLVESIAPADVLALQAGLEAMVQRAFSTVLHMRFHGGQADSPPSRRGGFGMWVTLYSALLRMGLSRAETLATPLDEVFVLCAVMQFMNGADVAGETYQQMDAGEENAASPIESPENH